VLWRGRPQLYAACRISTRALPLSERRQVSRRANDLLRMTSLRESKTSTLESWTSAPDPDLNGELRSTGQPGAAVPTQAAAYHVAFSPDDGPNP
jgi:hypothetical protein